MSLDKIKKRIKSFLFSDKSECLAVRGCWGTGKTYFWNSELNNTNKQKMKFDYYSYVSLFGVGSAEKFKMSIVANIRKKELINEKLDLIDLGAQFIRKRPGLIGRLTAFWNGKAAEEIVSLINDAYFLKVSNTLICIDDLERKDPKLNIEEILGIVSELKEQKNCKIVLIFNEENLEKGQRETYRLFREKIIDKEIEFNPTPEECASIAFIKSKYRELLTKYSTSLNIINIRILFQIKNLADDLLSIINKYPENIKENALHSLTLFCYIFYQNIPNFPKFEELRNIKSTFTAGIEDPSNEWKDIFRAYGYLMTSNLDLLIHDGVKNGYFDDEKLIVEANDIKRQLELEASQNSYYEAWDLYHAGFLDNEDELVDALDKAVRENYKIITPDNLNATVNVLRTLSKNDIADDLIKYYIDKRIDEIDLFNLSANYIPRNEPLDKKIASDFNAMYQSSLKGKTLKEVLQKIANTNSWDDLDKEVYRTSTANDLYDIFKSEYKDNLKKLIKAAFLVIPNQTREALKMIGAESPLNASRANQYGIKIE